MNLADLTVADFEGRVGDSFRIRVSPDAVLDAKLVEATALPGPENKSEGARDPFSLVFTTAGADVHEQGTYDVEHDELGKVGMFLVPIVQDADGVQYEAVFT